MLDDDPTAVSVPRPDDPWLRRAVALLALVEGIHFLEIGLRPPWLAPIALGLLLAGWRGRLGPRAWLIWAASGAILLAKLAAAPLESSNHHWLLTYMAGAAALSLSTRTLRADALLRHNARWLLTAVMAFATVHKLLSPHFLDGSYTGYMIARGSFADIPTRAVAELREVFAHNRELVAGLETTPPAVREVVELRSPLPGLEIWARGFAWLIVLGEAWILAVALRWSRSLVLHYSILGFVLVTATLRGEYVFLTTVTVLGALGTTREMVRTRRAYSGVAVVMASLAVARLLVRTGL